MIICVGTILIERKFCVRLISCTKSTTSPISNLMSHHGLCKISLKILFFFFSRDISKNSSKNHLRLNIFSVLYFLKLELNEGDMKKILKIQEKKIVKILYYG